MQRGWRLAARTSGCRGMRMRDSWSQVHTKADEEKAKEQARGVGATCTRWSAVHLLHRLPGSRPGPGPKRATPQTLTDPALTTHDDASGSGEAEAAEGGKEDKASSAQLQDSTFLLGLWKRPVCRTSGSLVSPAWMRSPLSLVASCCALPDQRWRLHDQPLCCHHCLTLSG